MSPSAHRRPRPPHRHAWMRVLTLLVVTILAAGTHVDTLAPTPVVASAGTDCGAEHDVLDTALRPPTRQDHRLLNPLRPEPTAPDGPEPAPRPRRVPPSHSRTLHALRSVVLRC
ncbi:hypothetical protein ABZ656_20505 [Streptomyces sp. NPDC007095]|uniref:hypothetical protein n=1 Tax=Streptomyces sp. NPDC007095 TaxID=3154482 RepID=UPI0033CFF244